MTKTKNHKGKKKHAKHLDAVEARSQTVALQKVAAVNGTAGLAQFIKDNDIADLVPWQETIVDQIAEHIADKPAPQYRTLQSAPFDVVGTSVNAEPGPVEVTPTSATSAGATTTLAEPVKTLYEEVTDQDFAALAAGIAERTAEGLVSPEEARWHEHLASSDLTYEVEDRPVVAVIANLNAEDVAAIRRAELGQINITDLRKYSKGSGIPGAYGLKKPDLIEAIIAAGWYNS